MENKGASQIGFVMSFVIFILFLVFMYSAIQPVLKTQASKQSLLDFLRLSLLDNFYAEDLTITTIYYKGDSSNPVKDCIQDEVGGTSLDGIITDENKDNLIIKDEEENIIDYDFQGGSNNFQMDLDSFDLRDSTDDAIFKIYYSDEITSATSSLSGCKEINIDDVVDVGSLVEEQNQIIESKIFSLIGLYESGGLKTTLGISEENDFVFAFEFANGTKIEPANVVIPDTNIYATTFPVQYLDVDANLKIGYLTIKVW